MATKISIEIPVVEGTWLRQSIDSILAQTLHDWSLTLLWDQGDELSRQILGELESLRDPRISIFYQETRLGIGRSRQFMSARSTADFLLPLTDCDLLDETAVERFCEHLNERPWCGVARARQGFMDKDGNRLDSQECLPLEPRQYFRGMTCDLHNIGSPYVIRKRVYDKTDGWEQDESWFRGGEDCNIFTKCEEYGDIELIDECLSWRRTDAQRTNHPPDRTADSDLWRRVAETTLERRQLSLHRNNDVPPFSFTTPTSPLPTAADVDFIIPFWESNEEEIDYEYSRPSQFFRGDTFIAKQGTIFHQHLSKPLAVADRLDITCSTFKPTTGTLSVSCLSESGSLISSGSQRIEGENLQCGIVPVHLEQVNKAETFARLDVKFRPDQGFGQKVYLHVWFDKQEEKSGDNAGNLWMSPFKHSPGYCRNRLQACLDSLKNRAGIAEESIKIIEKRQSSAANRNEGIAMSSKRFVCFVDDDTEIITTDAVEILLRSMEELDVDLVGPKLVTDTGMLYCVDPFFNEQGMPNPRGLGESDHNQYDYVSFVPWLPTTFLLVRRSVCCSVGGYDENYAGTQHEDVDFCLRARARGFRCAYIGEAAVKHYNCARNNCHATNLGYFNRRWADQPHLLSNDGCGRVEDVAAEQP